MVAVEILAYIVLVVGYGALCYIAGKGDFLNLIPLMLLEKAKELKEKTDGERKADG